MRDLPVTKVCEVEDFTHPALRGRLAELVVHRLGHLPSGYPVGREDRRDWEAAMALRALDGAGALRPDATVLGVAAGAHDIVFHVARSVRQLFLADRYLDPDAPGWMLRSPEAVSPFPLDRGRLVVQHMDGRHLRFPDGTFDAVFCTSRLGLASLLDMANAAFEIGRVLKAGGTASVGIDLRLSGPPGQSGWPGRPLLGRDHVARFVVAASGLELAGEPLGPVSDATLRTPRQLSLSPPDPDDPATRPEELPDLIRVEGGHAYTSAHLTLRKTEHYPCVPNDWARPSVSTIARVGRP